MSGEQWLRLVYLAGFLVLVLPAVLMYRGRRSKLLRDIAIWLAIACLAALAYLSVGPG